jgi:uncharacterized membrane protein YvbJ
MKYCYACGRMTAGEPLYCQSCGCTYDVKLCQRKHVNPRHAEVCSQCGSRDLSTPHPKIPPTWRALAFVGRVAVGLLLGYVVLVGVGELFTSPQTGNAIISLIFLAIALAVIWGMLPDWLRSIARWMFTKGTRRDGR